MMKLRYTIMAAGLLMMGLASCEMKNEILGKEEGGSEVGLLNLGVVVDAKSNNVQTKADATEGGDVQVPAVNATGYEVEISNSEGHYTTVTYDPANASVELPVGAYTLYAHKPGDPVETEPYYGGNTSFNIEKDKPTNVAVTCKMENTKIQLIYSTEMQASFTSWTITVTAGATHSKVFAYTGTELEQPAAFYWTLEEGVTEVKVSFVGTNKENKPVRESRTIKKPTTAENSDWLGGDALAITMSPGEYDPEDPTGVQGIEITAEVTWDGQEDSVDVPVVDDDGGDTPTDPEQPTDPDEKPAAPTITGDCLDKQNVYKKGDATYPTIEILMDVPGKIKDVRIQIETTDKEVFEGMLTDLGLTVEGGATLIDNQNLTNLFTLPKAGDLSYSFSLTNDLFALLSNFVGTHTFTMTVFDEYDQSKSEDLIVVVTE